MSEVQGIPSASDATTVLVVPFLPEGRAVAVSRGWDWLASAFELYKREPFNWSVIAVLCLAFLGVGSAVVFLGSIAITLLAPVLAGGVMIGCRELYHGRPLEIAHLFAGFKYNTGNLFMLGILALIAWFIVYAVAIAIVGYVGYSALMHGDLAAVMAMGLALLLALLIMLALSVPIYMALWFAPALVVFHDLAPLAALKASFIGSLKNILPFTFYSIIVFVLGVVAAIPLMLGFVVLIPVVLASIYTAYRDIYLAGEH